MDNKRRITHEGKRTLGNTIIPCYVLEDGTRVLCLLFKNKKEGGRNTAFTLKLFYVKLYIVTYFFIWSYVRSANGKNRSVHTHKERPKFKWLIFKLFSSIRAQTKSIYFGYKWSKNTKFTGKKE